MYTIPFSQLSLKDISKVGGKNASLGEMFTRLAGKGINVPDGFATTANSFLFFLKENKLEESISKLLLELDTANFSNLSQIGGEIRKLIQQGSMPVVLHNNIEQAYNTLCDKYGSLLSVAVRSSATAEDLPTASFAGQHDSFLNQKGIEEICSAIKRCFVSLYNNRAIKYRCDNGFGHDKVLLSAGVQMMVRSDLACSGISFTLEPESGFRDVVAVSGCWGLGENIVQGAVNPDEFIVFKPALRQGKLGILSKKCGSKAKTMIYGDGESKLLNTDTSPDKRIQFVLTDLEIEKIAAWSMTIEEHYKCPMDIEWAKDGVTGQIFILQARPETVHAKKDPYVITEYLIKNKGPVLTQGSAIGSKISSGIARIINSPADADRLKEGEVLVTDITNPDWDPVLKRAAAIITNKGGRTSHAAIVARELGTNAIVGTMDATKKIKDGDSVTVSCAQGKTGIVYEGILPWQEKEINVRDIKMPVTAAMLILGDPDKAFKYPFYPNSGIGLMRLEFIINNVIRIHPMALAKFDELKDDKTKREIESITGQYADKKEYFVDKLAQAVATIAAAFYPKDVIVRMSDFKTNEYANLIGGQNFEPVEENPMIGFRGASRYYNDRYQQGFRLECEAMKRVRGEMGLTNVKLMIPFCRTVEEGVKVVHLMNEYGLKRGRNGLEIYVMAEIPSNVLLAKEFAEVFDGFSIGSNDLTQLTLGLDRDSAIISGLFDENNAAVKIMISNVIRDAHASRVKIGLCGQAPSDFPEFAKFLVEHKIDSISYTPDALLKGIENMVKAEVSRLPENEIINWHNI